MLHPSDRLPISWLIKSSQVNELDSIESKYNRKKKKKRPPFSFDCHRNIINTTSTITHYLPGLCSFQYNSAIARPKSGRNRLFGIYSMLFVSFGNVALFTSVKWIVFNPVQFSTMPEHWRRPIIDLFWWSIIK